MGPTRILLAVSLVLMLGGLPAVAGTTSHAMELDQDGSVLFVDLEHGRLGSRMCRRGMPGRI